MWFLNISIQWSALLTRHWSRTTILVEIHKLYYLPPSPSGHHTPLCWETEQNRTEHNKTQWERVQASTPFFSSSVLSFPFSCVLHRRNQSNKTPPVLLMFFSTFISSSLSVVCWCWQYQSSCRLEYLRLRELAEEANWEHSFAAGQPDLTPEEKQLENTLLSYRHELLHNLTAQCNDATSSIPI